METALAILITLSATLWLCLDSLIFSKKALSSANRRSALRRRERIASNFSGLDVKR